MKECKPSESIIIADSNLLLTTTLSASINLQVHLFNTDDALNQKNIIELKKINKNKMYQCLLKLLSVLMENRFKPRQLEVIKRKINEV